jgi:hypothetical protein
MIINMTFPIIKNSVIRPISSPLWCFHPFFKRETENELSWLFQTPPNHALLVQTIAKSRFFSFSYLPPSLLFRFLLLQ